MDYKEKYEQGLECIQEILCGAGDSIKTSILRKRLQPFFPELQESEDERIRKALIEYFEEQCDMSDWNGVYGYQVLAWLEKQGIQPTDKVEPKFKVRDWITNGHYTRLIVGVNSRHYQFKNGDAKYIDDIDKNYHLWSIADAKDGDVLVASDGSIFLFAGVDDCACKYYVALTTDNYVKINYVKINKEVDSGYWETSRAVYPATKEQRDLLFRKMDDAGYEWDSEKKELKKAEPEFHEGDWAVYNNDICQIVKREEGCNKLVTVFGIEKELVNERNLSTARLWTIQDARDGDVLVDEDNNIGLYQEEKDDLYWHSYIYIGCDNCLRGFGGYHNYENTKPATKEQRDLLFQKMADAGYEWDVDKKELKKIGTKFNTDDWIVTDDSFGKIVRHIVEINLINEEYIVSDENGLYYILPFSHEHKWHKWTILDADDGDVLASELTGSIFLFRGIKDDKIDFYCDYDTYLEWPEPEPDDRFGINDTDQHYGSVEESQDIHPATKELRDLLFAKIKEAGYEWDWEKKELRKVEYRTLDAGKVIEWIRKYWPFKCWGNVTLLSDDVIEQFKKDFGM